MTSMSLVALSLAIEQISDVKVEEALTIVVVVSSEVIVKISADSFLSKLSKLFNMTTFPFVMTRQLIFSSFSRNDDGGVLMTTSPSSQTSLSSPSSRRHIRELSSFSSTTFVDVIVLSMLSTKFSS